MKIAVVGSGIAGLTSAYLLAPKHEITIYEKDSRIGGHAHTLHVQEGDVDIAVDNGFMVFNPERYPNFVEILKDLDVPSVPTDMSMSVSIPGEISYRGEFPEGIFAVRRNIINIRFWKFLLEVLRFRRAAKRSLERGEGTAETLDEFTTRYGFSRDLSNWYLYPMLSAIWSVGESEKVGDFPALTTFQFMQNHRILDTIKPRWRTIPGGSEQYVSRLRERLDAQRVNIRLGADISRITRTASSVTIECGTQTNTYDYVLFATHADVTAELLPDANEEERSALACFRYSTNVTVLHKDTSVAPTHPKLLSSWNYLRVLREGDSKPTAVFSYCMNILQHIPLNTPVFVTLNPHVPLDPSKVYAEETYAHPQFNLSSLEGQQRIAALQGKNRTLYAGAHLGYGFHEDGVVSAIEAVRHIGVAPPWQS